MATHSSNLAWRIPWTEDPGGALWGHIESGKTEHTGPFQGVIESDMIEQLTLLHTQVIRNLGICSGFSALILMCMH